MVFQPFPISRFSNEKGKYYNLCHTYCFLLFLCLSHSKAASEKSPQYAGNRFHALDAIYHPVFPFPHSSPEECFYQIQAKTRAGNHGQRSGRSHFSHPPRLSLRQGNELCRVSYDNAALYCCLDVVLRRTEVERHCGGFSPRHCRHLFLFPKSFSGPTPRRPDFLIDRVLYAFNGPCSTF